MKVVLPKTDRKLLETILERSGVLLLVGTLLLTSYFITIYKYTELCIIINEEETALIVNLFFIEPCIYNQPNCDKTRRVEGKVIVYIMILQSVLHIMSA